MDDLTPCLRKTVNKFKHTPWPNETGADALGQRAA